MADVRSRLGFEFDLANSSVGYSQIRSIIPITDEMVPNFREEEEVATHLAESDSELEGILTETN